MRPADCRFLVNPWPSPQSVTLQLTGGGSRRSRTSRNVFLGGLCLVVGMSETRSAGYFYQPASTDRQIVRRYSVAGRGNPARRFMVPVSFGEGDVSSWKWPSRGANLWQFCHVVGGRSSSIFTVRGGRLSRPKPVVVTGPRKTGAAGRHAHWTRRAGKGLSLTRGPRVYLPDSKDIRKTLGLFQNPCDFTRMCDL